MDTEENVFTIFRRGLDINLCQFKVFFTGSETGGRKNMNETVHTHRSFTVRTERKKPYFLYFIGLPGKDLMASNDSHCHQDARR